MVYLTISDHGSIGYCQFGFLGIHMDTGWFDLHYGLTHWFLFGLWDQRGAWLNGIIGLKLW